MLRQVESSGSIYPQKFNMLHIYRVISIIFCHLDHNNAIKRHGALHVSVSSCGHSEQTKTFLPYDIFLYIPQLSSFEAF